MRIEVTVAGLALDEKSRAPIVLLKNEEKDLMLPIVIGIMEASAIAAQLEGVDFPRPMTHDLLKAVIGKMGGTVTEVAISDLSNDTFYALLHVEQEGTVRTVDCRPSDGIALALRANAPITVEEKVFKLTRQKPPVATDGEDLWEEILETMDDEDFGKYKM